MCMAIHSLVLDIEGCVVSDQNAASLTVRFYDADIGFEKDIMVKPSTFFR